MIEVEPGVLVISFPEVHPDAVLRLEFQRTLRIPDEDHHYRLSAGRGRFPLRRVDDFRARVPAQWLTKNAVMLPMFRSEAMGLGFESPKGYPIAVKVATENIDAVTGADWRAGLHRDPQDYMTIPEQSWLDGYCDAKGLIRQFVAMPLGSGESAEAQLIGSATQGGIRIVAYPMTRAAYERRARQVDSRSYMLLQPMVCEDAAVETGVASRGGIEQRVHEDPHVLQDWDQSRHGQCFVHFTDAHAWRAITGEDPPTRPPAPDEYARAGLPWLESFNEETKTRNYAAREFTLRRSR